jgi:hypothetical protein
MVRGLCAPKKRYRSSARIILVPRFAWSTPRTRAENEEKRLRLSWCGGFCTAKSDVARTGIGGCATTGAGTVAFAVTRAAQEGPSFSDMLIDFIRMTRIPAIRGPQRIVAYRLAGHLHVRVGTIKVTHPIPHIASHIIESITVWRKRSNGSRSDESIFSRVAVGKFACPRVGHEFPFEFKFVPHG